MTIQRFYTIIAFFLFKLSLCAQEFPKAILRGDYPDPSIMRDGDDYYMTHSPFTYSPGFLIWHSRDLINWEPVVRAMPEIVGSAMAPDLLKHKGRYYIYFPAAGSNWVIWADNIRGPWSRPIDLKVGRIDPGHAIGEDGGRYLFLSAGGMCPLAADGLSVAGSVKEIYKGWEYPADWITECMCLESPKIFRKGEYFYMVTAEGGTAGPATSHMAIAARSKSINGPWENSPYNPIVHTYKEDEHWWSKGHGTVIDDPKGNWYIVYHGYEKGFHTLGRQTLIEPLEWTSDGWFKTSQKAEELPSAFRHNGFELSDNFKGDKLGLQWTSWKGYDPAVYQFTKKGLGLKSKGTDPSDAELLLATAADQNYEVQVEILLNKSSKAGLGLFYSDKAFCGLLSDGKYTTIYNNAADARRSEKRLGRHFFLKIINKANTCDFLVSKDSKNWTALKSGLDVSGLNHNNYGGFFALRVALISAGGGSVLFRNFTYSELK